MISTIVYLIPNQPQLLSEGFAQYSLLMTLHLNTT